MRVFKILISIPSLVGKCNADCFGYVIPHQVTIQNE